MLVTFCWRKFASILYTVTVVVLLLLALYLMRQVRQLYDDNQKFYRLQGYVKDVEDVFRTLEVVEGNMNRVSVDFHLLKEVANHSLIVQDPEPQPDSLER